MTFNLLKTIFVDIKNGKYICYYKDGLNDKLAENGKILIYIINILY